MSGLQLIFCVETNSKCKSDFVYIRNTIDHFYDYDRAHVQFRPVYMDGKGNYNTRKTDRKIKELSVPFERASKNNESYTLFCFDCDDYDANPSDSRFLNDAYSFCKKKDNYRFVWFCKDVEDVYLGRRIENHQKKKEAEEYARKGLIKTLNINHLNFTSYLPHRSNLCVVLDEFLNRKGK